MRWRVEYTDTFGGEANYSWLRRYEIETKQDASRAAVMRAAKSAAGLSGVRGRTEDRGDMLRFVPFRSCTVLFVNPII